MNILEEKIEIIPRINQKYAAPLKRLNIETVRDFLFHFPFRYEDYSERVLIDDLITGSTATIMGEVTQSKLVRTWKKKLMITECYVQDETGLVRAVWFNQPYISDSLTQGKGVRLSGKVSQDAKGLFFSNPAWELSSREPTNTGRLVPVYPETEGITSRWIRWQMSNIFKLSFEIEDPIPENILSELHLPKIKDALKYIHFPKSEDEFEIAQKRFAFEEIFLVQLTSLQTKKSWQEQNAVAIPFNEKLIKNFVQSLPFTLTDAQRKAAFQIFKDLERTMPMNRLLNGDVGSGKTIVAALASLANCRAGFQTAIMAPTEILAEQHYATLCELFKNNDIKIALLTNSYQEISNLKIFASSLSSGKISNFKLKENRTLLRKELLQKIKDGDIDLVIGTHALIQKAVEFKKLSLVIVDEQHRFGVQQRAYLQNEISKSNDGLLGKIPHLLSMTATPIPRTLSLAFFGNLDLSVLDEMPKNRKLIKTELVSRLKVSQVYDFVRSEIKNGRQAFIIFPLVEESKILTELKAATEEHDRLSKKIFPNLKIGLLHGKMKSSDKEIVMENFKSKKYDILVATSVVEVGIDIPNASVMIIEDADRFGLSQLHQFRGRVGRGEHQSYCFLLTSSNTTKAKSRLKALVSHSSGFDIAEEDLKLRGPGEFFGSRQSGLPDITMQHIANTKLIEFAHDYALETLTADPTLKNNPLLKARLKKFTQSVHLE
jgi:ATP-dependent DNA helicase RecG